MFLLAQNIVKKCPTCGKPVGFKLLVNTTVLGRSIVCNSCNSNLRLESKLILEIALFLSASGAIYFYQSPGLLISFLAVTLFLMFLYFATGILKASDNRP